MYRPCFVFRHPTSMVRNVFLQPFTVHVWYCVFVVGIVVIGSTSLISRREEKKSSGKIRFVNLNITQAYSAVFPNFFLCFFLLLSFSLFSLSFFFFLPFCIYPLFFIGHPFSCITLHFDVLLLCVGGT